MKLIFLTLLTLIPAFLTEIKSSTAHAESICLETDDAGQSKCGINGQSYYKTGIIWDFANSVITRSLWYDAYPDPKRNLTFSRYEQDAEKNNEEIQNQKKLYDQFLPGLGEYVFRSNGLPRPFSINKWNGKVTIGVDWQKVRHGDKVAIGHGFNSGGDWGAKKFYPLFEDQISKIIPDLKKHSGLDIKLISAEEESVEAPARIRVIPVQNPKKSPFKRKLPDQSFVMSTEAELVTAVPFTSAAENQVDGFFVPNADNSIGYAACKINVNLPERQIRSLINECLLRVMGIPELSRLNKASALGEWNKNGRSTIKTEEIYLYDRFMLSLLYCKEIKPGMSFYEIVRVLKRNDACFSTLEEN